MEEKLFGLELSRDYLEIVRRDGHYYVRWDVGSHVAMWREDEVTEDEAKKIASGDDAQYQVLISIQNRLGFGANDSNWTPPTNA